MTQDATVADMMGETITAIGGMEKGSDEVTFTAASGRTFRLYHSQDCCESVSVEDVIGNVDDLIGSPLLKSEAVSNVDGIDEEVAPNGAESWTWTFYLFATVKGYVTLRWLGESNGYYSEGVDFVEDR